MGTQDHLATSPQTQLKPGGPSKASGHTQPFLPFTSSLLFLPDPVLGGRQKQISAST